MGSFLFFFPSSDSQGFSCHSAHCCIAGTKPDAGSSGGTQGPVGALILETWSGGSEDGGEEPHAFLQTLRLLPSCCWNPVYRAGPVAGALGWVLCRAHLVALLLGLCARPLSGHLPRLWALLLLYRLVLWDCHGI